MRIVSRCSLFQSQKLRAPITYRSLLAVEMSTQCNLEDPDFRQFYLCTSELDRISRRVLF
jgi:hypothetical protein